RSPSAVPPLPALEADALEPDAVAVETPRHELAHAFRIGSGAACTLEPRLQEDRVHVRVRLLHLEPGNREEGAPFGLRVVPDMRRIANAVSLLGRLVHEEVVGNEHEVTGDAPHLAD